VYSRRKVAAFDCPEKIEVVDKILVHCLSGPMTVNRPILAAVRKGPSNLYYVGSRQLKTAARSTRDALHPSPAGKTGPVRAWMAWPVGEARPNRGIRRSSVCLAPVVTSSPATGAHLSWPLHCSNYLGIRGCLGSVLYVLRQSTRLTPTGAKLLLCAG
jgi:hypothetical protein